MAKVTRRCWLGYIGFSINTQDAVMLQKYSLVLTCEDFAINEWKMLITRLTSADYSILNSTYFLF